jgi:hypothetical protein
MMQSTLHAGNKISQRVETAPDALYLGDEGVQVELGCLLHAEALEHVNDLLRGLWRKVAGLWSSIYKHVKSFWR